MNFTNLHFIAFALFLFFSGCNDSGSHQDEMDALIENTDHELGDEGNGDEHEGESDKVEVDYLDKEDCFDFVYPLSYLMPDGSTITGNDEDAIGKILKEWYSNNSETDVKPKLILPVEIIFPDKDILTTINNQEDWEKAKKACKEDWNGKEDCFKFVYPISYLMPDGTTLTGSEEEEMDKLLKDWYSNNDETDFKAMLLYPVEIVFPDRDAILTIENDEELENAKKACEEDWEEDDDEECFKFIYPLSYIMPDGTALTGANEVELDDKIKNWFLEHGDLDREPKLLLPLDIEFKDGVIFTINVEEDWHRVRELCKDEHGEDDKEYDCEELRADFGDPCRNDDGVVGTINEYCECK